MIYVATGMLLLYYFLFLLYYQHLLLAQGTGFIQNILFLAIIFAAYMFLNVKDTRWLGIPVIMAATIAGLRFAARMNWLQAVFGGSLCVLIVYCFRGIFTAISAFIFRRRDFLSDANAYYTITLIALPFSILFMAALRRIIFPDKKLQHFLNNRGQLKLVISYEIVAATFLAIINTGRYLSPHGMWYLEIALGACVFILGMLVYVMYHSIRSTELLEYQLRNQMLEEQYDRQLRHYKSYQKYTESFRIFQHDYKSMMASLKSLIGAHENQKAVQLLDDIYTDMQKKVQVHQKYSDHVTLDAMLQDLAEICAEKEIRFTCNVFIPRSTKLSLLDSIRIFSNITNNAVEACQKIGASERFIHMISRNDQQWVTLEIINSYNGELVVENGRFVSTKSQKDKHGYGLRSVTEIVENLGGFIIYNADTKNRTFLLRVHIPRMIHDSK